MQIHGILVVWITSSIEKCIALILKIFFDAGKQNCQNTYYYSLMPNLTLKLEQLNSMKQLHFCNDNKTLHHQFIQSMICSTSFLLSCGIIQIVNNEEEQTRKFCLTNTFLSQMSTFHIFCLQPMAAHALQSDQDQCLNSRKNP